MAVTPWVVCIPGFGGSTLGYSYHAAFDNLAAATGLIPREGWRECWLSTSWILWSGFAGLELDFQGRKPREPHGIRLYPLGVVPGYYDTMHSALLRGGFRPIWVSYDWRMRLEDVSAGILNATLQYAEDEPFAIVAHSRGGLAAAQLLQQLKDRSRLSQVRKLATFGTPWYGTYLAAPWLDDYVRNDSSKIQLVLVAGRLLKRQDLLSQASQVVRSFPALYELLPDPSRAVLNGDAHVAKMYDPDWWRYQGDGGGIFPPFPDKTVDHGIYFLDALQARQLGSLLPPAGVNWRAYASEAIKTFGGFTHPTFRFHFSRITGTQPGDGVVPAWSATAEGAEMLWTNFGHGQMVQGRAPLDDLVTWLNAE